MSYYEMLPVGQNKGDWDDWDEAEREDFLADTYGSGNESIARVSHEARAHDQDGYWAELAGSDACAALGHVQPDSRPEFDPDLVDEEAVEDAYNDALAEWDEMHPWGWDDRICIATRYGSACTTCEGECDYEHMRRVPKLWSLPGVMK